MTIGAGETILAADIQAIKDDVDKLTDAAADEVLTGETTTSTTYTDLSTAGPSVTVTTGTLAWVNVAAEMENNTGGQLCFATLEVSGASTETATDNRALIHESGNANDRNRSSVMTLLTALSAGSNTFTIKYKVSGGTGTFRRRRIEVMPVGD